MFSVIDIETTGLNEWKNDIITIGAVVVDDNLDVIKEKEFKMKPDSPHYWSADAEGVHRITLDEALEFPEQEEVISDIIDFLPGSSTFIYHAMARFDYRFMFALFWKHEMRAEFYKLFPNQQSTIDPKHKKARERWQIENQKLDTWAHKLGLKFKHHNSLEDARLCYNVFKYQRSQQEFKQPNSN